MLYNTNKKELEIFLSIKDLIKEIDDMLLDNLFTNFSNSIIDNINDVLNNQEVQQKINIIENIVIEKIKNLFDIDIDFEILYPVNENNKFYSIYTYPSIEYNTNNLRKTKNINGKITLGAYLIFLCPRPVFWGKFCHELSHALEYINIKIKNVYNFYEYDEIQKKHLNKVSFNGWYDNLDNFSQKEKNYLFKIYLNDEREIRAFAFQVISQVNIRSILNQIYFKRKILKYKDIVQFLIENSEIFYNLYYKNKIIGKKIFFYIMNKRSRTLFLHLIYCELIRRELI